MMKKPTYEEKIQTLERYIERPQAVTDPEVLRAIKSDVVKAHSKGVKKASELPDEGAEHIVSEKEDNRLYNSAMGVYRQFVKEKGSYFDMDGRNAALYSTAMRSILKFIKGFQESNGKPSDDENVLEGIVFMFKHWDRLNDFLKGRIQLPQIATNIQEILLKIRNGADSKSAAKDELQLFEQSLKK